MKNIHCDPLCILTVSAITTVSLEGCSSLIPEAAITMKPPDTGSFASWICLHKICLTYSHRPVWHGWPYQELRLKPA